MEIEGPSRLSDGRGAFSEVPLSKAAILVLTAATEHALVEVFSPEGQDLSTSGDTRVSFKGGFVYAEDVALAHLNGNVGPLDAFLKAKGPGLTIRLTTTLDPWAKLLGTSLRSLLKTAEVGGAKLEIVSARGSDADQITAKAQAEAFGVSKAVTVVRYNPKDKNAKGPIYLFKDGASDMAAIFKDENPGSFGADDDLEDTLHEVQKAALGGLASTLLLSDSAEVKGIITDATGKHPELVKVFEGTATYDDMRTLFDGFEKWDTIKGKNGANYLLFYSSGGLTAGQFLDELNSGEYNCVGMAALIASLKEFCKVPGNSGKPFVMVNSGETTVVGRPLLHMGDKEGGNALPRAIGRAIKNLYARVSVAEGGSEGCAEPTLSVCKGWDTYGVKDTFKASRFRMIYEAVFSALLRTQQGPSDRLRKEVSGMNFFLGGMNFVSCGAQRGDPLRAAGCLQKGELGRLKLQEILEGMPAEAHGVEFLISGLAEAKAMGREVALACTAKYAYKSYCSMVASKAMVEPLRLYKQARDDPKLRALLVGAYEEQREKKEGGEMVTLDDAARAGYMFYFGEEQAAAAELIRAAASDDEGRAELVGAYERYRKDKQEGKTTEYTREARAGYMIYFGDDVAAAAELIPAASDQEGRAQLVRAYERFRKDKEDNIAKGEAAPEYTREARAGYMIYFGDEVAAAAELIRAAASDDEARAKLLGASERYRKDKALGLAAKYTREARAGDTMSRGNNFHLNRERRLEKLRLDEEERDEQPIELPKWGVKSVKKLTKSNQQLYVVLNDARQKLGSKPITEVVVGKVLVVGVKGQKLTQLCYVTIMWHDPGRDPPNYEETNTMISASKRFFIIDEGTYPPAYPDIQNIDFS